jgi:hypothetical protein
LREKKIKNQNPHSAGLSRVDLHIKRLIGKILFAKGLAGIRSRNEPKRGTVSGYFQNAREGAEKV